MAMATLVSETEFPDPEHLSFPRTPGAVPGWHRLEPHSASWAMWAARSWLGACLKGHFLTLCRSHCGILRCGQGRGIQVRTPGVWELEDLTVELRPGKCLEDSGLLGLEHPLCPGSRGALALLISHLLLAEVAPSYPPVHPSPSSLPCSTQRSAAAAWRGTRWPGELFSAHTLSTGLDPQSVLWATGVCRRRVSGHLLKTVTLTLGLLSASTSAIASMLLENMYLTLLVRETA